jgi:hypothetical protein
MTSRIPLALVVAVMALPLSQATPAHVAPNCFDPTVVFGARSEGNGTLQLGLGKARPFHVTSSGVSRDGHVRLHQEVQFDGKKATTRDWDLSASGPDHYVGTLTDAAGPVDAHVQGRRLSLHYRLNDHGLAMYQTLDLAADGRTIDTRATVRFLGRTDRLAARDDHSQPVVGRSDSTPLAPCCIA